MARVSASFNTSLVDLSGMAWNEALLWYPEALAIWQETWGMRGSHR